MHAVRFTEIIRLKSQLLRVEKPPAVLFTHRVFLVVEHSTLCPGKTPIDNIR